MGEPIYKIDVVGGERTGDKVSVKSGTALTVRTISSSPMVFAEEDAPNASGGGGLRIESLTATFLDREVFRSTFYRAVSANPYLAFSLAPPKTGTLIVTWLDADGSEWSESREIVVA